jgi:multicomponent K+:H+ antiporter subunit A
MVAAIAPIASLAIVLVLAQQAGVAAGGAVTTAVPWAPAAGLSFALRLDGLALLFLALVFGIGLLIVLYGAYYIDDRTKLPRFFALLLAFMGAMTGVVLADDLVLLVTFWELTSFTSFLLVGWKSDEAAARRGARRALVVTGAGGLALLGGAVLLGAASGETTISGAIAAAERVRAHGAFPLLFALVALGALTKSAQVPFHGWLPRAMTAPTPASAYLHSATMVKAGVYLLARVHPIFAGSSLWLYVIGGVGLTTLVAGAYGALVQYDLKGLLAYSTLSHLGLIVALLGFGTEASAVAAIFHVLNHATFKAALFMAAGIVEHETGTRDMRLLSGLARPMPITAALAIISAAAMAGVPLFNGFLSKEMFFTEALATALPFPLELLVPAAATVAGLFSVTYSLRFIHEVFFSGPPGALPRTPHEPPRWMRVPVEVLSLFCLVVGIAPWLVDEPLLASAARAMLNGKLPAYELALWHGVNLPLGMTLVAFAGGVLLFRRLPSFHARRAPIPLVLSENFVRGVRALFRPVRALAGALDRLDRGGSTTVLRSVFVGVVMVGLVEVAALLRDRVRGGVPLDQALLAFDLRGVTPSALLLVAMLAGGALATAVFRRRRLVAVLSLSTVGAIVALLFVLFAAPDLALTQLLIEIVTIVLFLFLLSSLPKREPEFEVATSRPTTGGGTPHAGDLHVRRDALLAALAGVLAFGFLNAILATPSEPVGPELLAASEPIGHGRNAVNVILVDFRGFDTLGEITVMVIGAVGVAALLGRSPSGTRGPGPWARDAAPVILVWVSQMLVPLAVVLAAHLFLRGHHLPGGGFVAALLVSIALLLPRVARGGARGAEREVVGSAGSGGVERRAETGGAAIRIGAIGVVLAVCVGLASLFFGRAYLTRGVLHGHVPFVGEVEIASAMAFDAAVVLAVLGAVLVILGRLAETAPPLSTGASGSLPSLGLEAARANDATALARIDATASHEVRGTADAANTADAGDGNAPFEREGNPWVP